MKIVINGNICLNKSEILCILIVFLIFIEYNSQSTCCMHSRVINYIQQK